MAKASEKRKLRYSNAKKVAEGMDKGFKPTTFKVPEGMTLHRFDKPGKFKIDIMPYVVGKGNPAEDVAEGDVHFERTFFVHKNAGLPHHFTCNRLTFGKPCVACKHVAKLASDPDADEDLIQELKPKKRQLWIWRDRANKEAGYQLSETPHYKSFGELVKDEIDNAGDDDPAARFHHLKGGATCVVKVKKSSYNGKNFMQVTSLEFEDREKDYKESVLDEMPCLDDLIVPADQDDLKEALAGGGDDEDEDDDKKAKKAKSKKSKKKEDEDDDSDDEDDEDDSDEESDDDEDAEAESEGEEEDEEEEEVTFSKGDKVTHKKFGDCTIVKANKDGDVFTLEDEDGDEHRGVKAKELTAVEEDEDEEEDEDSDDGDEAEIEVGSVVEYVYKKKKRKGEVVKIKKDIVTIDEEETDEKRVMKMDELSLADTDDEDEDSDEDDEDEKPAKKSKKKKDEDDEDDDDIPFEEDEDEDDEEDEKPKKKGKK